MVKRVERVAAANSELDWDTVPLVHHGHEHTICLRIPKERD